MNTTSTGNTVKATTFTFSPQDNEWHNSQVALSTVRGTAIPAIGSQEDMQRCIGQFHCLVQTDTGTFSLYVDLHHTARVGSEEGLAQAIASENNLADFMRDTGLPPLLARALTDTIAQSLNEGCNITGDIAFIYDPVSQGDIAYPWTVKRLIVANQDTLRN